MGVEYLDDHRLRNADANAECNHDAGFNANAPAAIAHCHATIGNSHAAVGDAYPDPGLHAQPNPGGNADRDARSASPGAQSLDSDASSAR
jgi:hypothetical protein